MSASTETDVLIIGGGPSGLAAAMELGLRGVDCLVIEPRTGVSMDRPRAKTTSVRTMEHFRRWGLADDIRAAAPLPVAWSQDVVFCTSLLGIEITRFHHCFGLAPGRVDTFAESGQQIPQPLVERVLRNALTQLSMVRLAFGAYGMTIEETSSHVDVGVRAADGADLHVRAQYVLGCDGVAGITRAAIGARYVGSSDVRPNLNIVFRAPGLAEKVPHGPAVHYWVINEEVSGVLGPLNLTDTWFAGGVGIDDAGKSVDPLCLVRKLIGAEVSAEVLGTDHWTARMLLADRFASERVFLVGDAAHLNPPWGGHGFNTGVGDAVNISWKLAAVLAGWGGNGLLTSYAYERRLVAARTIDASSTHLRRTPIDLATPALTAEGAVGEAARREAAREIQERKESEFHSLGLTLGYHYRGSPIVAEKKDPCPSEQVIHYEPTAQAGCRLPHAWLPDGRSLYDRLGSDYTLLQLSPAVDPAPLSRAAAASGVPLAVVDLCGLLDENIYGASLVLVRPDHHIAWCGRLGDTSPTDVVDLLRGARNRVGCT